MTATSSQTLLVIRLDEVDADDPRWEQQLSEISDDVYRWTGNHAQIVEFGESELRGLIDEDHSTIASIEPMPCCWPAAGSRPVRLGVGRPGEHPHPKL